MCGYLLVMSVVVLGLSLGSGDLAWSQNSQTGQDEGNSSQISEKKQDSSNPKDQYQLFSPLKPGGEEQFLLLDPDGKTVSDYQKLLPPLDRIDKKPDR